jgi:sulfite exporter TauE/SafE
MQLIKPIYAAITNPAVPLAQDGSAAGTGFAFYVSQLWKTSVIVGGLAFLLYALIGGLNMIMAGGDAKKVETAQKHLTNGLIGLIILVGSYAIMALISDVLQIDILNIDWTFGG